MPFEPVDGPDNRFGQINVPIGKTPFAEAGIRGFEPTKPFKIPVNYSHVLESFYWPTVQELDDEINPFPWMEGEQECVEAQGDSLESIPTMYHGPPPAPLIPVNTSPTIPSVGTLATDIVRSSDRLFFITYCATNPSFPE